MCTWVVSQLCSQHDIMHVSLEYMASVLSVIYQVFVYYIVCVCVQVIQVINIAAYWAISTLGNITYDSLILRHWHYTCSHSSSPIPFTTSVPWLISTEYISEASSISSCVSVCHSLIQYFWQVEIPHRWDYGCGWFDRTTIFAWADTLWHNYLLIHCHLLYNKQIWGVV